jgi:hypothetical protein
MSSSRDTQKERGITMPCKVSEVTASQSVAATREAEPWQNRGRHILALETTLITMSRPRWHDFLLKNALFPFPEPEGTESTTISTAEISQIEAGMLEREWKANYAMRDDGLVQKLCQTLQVILGDTILPAGAKDYLLAGFLPRIQVDDRGRPDGNWNTNPNEIKVRFLKGSRSLFKAK